MGNRTALLFLGIIGAFLACWGGVGAGVRVAQWPAVEGGEYSKVSGSSGQPQDTTRLPHRRAESLPWLRDELTPHSRRPGESQQP